jgi:hypothetical protein
VTHRPQNMMGSPKNSLFFSILFIILGRPPAAEPLF